MYSAVDRWTVATIARTLTMYMPKQDVQLRLAKISALQAVVVAMIAAIGGIVAGYVGHERITGTALNPKRG